MNRSSSLALLAFPLAVAAHAWAQPSEQSPPRPVAPPEPSPTATGMPEQAPATAAVPVEPAPAATAGPQASPAAPRSKPRQPSPPSSANAQPEGRSAPKPASRTASTPYRRPSPSRSTLVVEVEGIRNERGMLRLALFEGAAGFPNDSSRARRASIVPVRGQRSRVVWSDLEPGSYAVALLHDENDNGVLDKNWVGMPTEGSGFSRDATASWGPPTYEDAAQLLVADRVSRSVIHVFYF